MSHPEFEEPETHYLTEEMDHEILKHRDAHFAGDFKIMRSFYENESFGAHPEFDLERIIYLEQVEQELKQNLSDLFLSTSERDEIRASLTAYEKLKEVYSNEKESGSAEQLLADLILTEEEDPQEEIAQIVLLKEKMVAPLIKLISTPQSFDPLFPGYGFAPYFAIICLGQIQDPRAIVPLFALLGKEALFDEQVILDAFREIGEPAKEFLLKMLVSSPITKENINAAFALSVFPSDEKIAQVALQQLKIACQEKNSLLCTYLLCLLDTPTAAPLKVELATFAKSLSATDKIQREIQAILAKW